MLEAICPKCATVNEVGDELIGRYTICNHCRCRFYVEVPTLAQSFKAPAAPIRETAKHETAKLATTLDDLLWDTQQGGRFVMRELAENRRLLQRMTWAIVVLGVLTVANLICTLWS